MKDFYISAKISVDDSQDIQEFKRLEHHAEFLFDLESYPEIKEVSDLNVVESGSTPENLLNAITAVCSNCKELSLDDSKACLNCPVKKLNALK
jgi:hypothetical protein